MLIYLLRRAFRKRYRREDEGMEKVAERKGDEMERLRSALAEIVAAIDKRWADEPERKRANAISPRMEEAIKAARVELERCAPTETPSQERR